MNKIELELKKHGIHVAYLETNEPGCFIQEKNLMVISNKLSEEETCEVLCHEFSHFIMHSEKLEDYRDLTKKVCMENDANASMINLLAEDNDGYFNYSGAIEKYHIALGWELGLEKKTN